MFRWTFNPRTLPFSTIKRVSFPPLWSPLLPLFRRRVYTPLWNFRLYSYANSSLFSPFSPCVRRTDHSLLLLLLLLLFSCSSSSFPFISRSQSKETKKEKKKTKQKRKERKNIIHLVIVHLSQEGSLCSVFPSLRQKDKLDVIRIC